MIDDQRPGADTSNRFDYGFGELNQELEVCSRVYEEVDGRVGKFLQGQVSTHTFTARTHALSMTLHPLLTALSMAGKAPSDSPET